MLTWLPPVGTTVGTDERLYEVDGHAVYLWTSTRPAWRDFAPGMTDGPDVAQLERNLVGLVPDNHFSAAAAAAVRRWQVAHGLPATGREPLGQIVFLPGPVRISAWRTAIGTPLRSGLELLGATRGRRTTRGLTLGLLDLVRAYRRRKRLP